MWMVRWIVVAVLLIILLGFSLLNLDQKVDVNLVFAYFADVPLLLVLFESFIAGMLVWFAVSFVTVAGMQRQLRALRKERDRLFQQVPDEGTSPAPPVTGQQRTGSVPGWEDKEEGPDAGF